MSAVTGEWPSGLTPQWMQTTQPQITTAFLNMTGLGWDGSCTSAGTNTTIVDTSLANAYSSDRNWKGAWVRFTGGTANNLGQIRQIQSYTPATGTLTFSPAASAATASSDTYEVWMTTMEPRVVLNMLDRITSNYGLGLTTYSIVTEVPDGDMEQVGTTAYTGVNATLAKVTDFRNPGIFGKRALEVTTTSAGGYAELAQPLRIQPTSSLQFSVVFTPADDSVTNTGFIYLIDADTGSTLTSITTTAKATVRLWQSFGYGNGNVKRLQIRIGSSENGVTGRWDDLMIMSSQSRKQPLPFWMGTDSAFKQAFFWVPSNSGPGQFEYDPELVGPPAVGWRPKSDAFTAGGRPFMEGPTYPGGRMMFVEGVRFETAWESLTDTKRIDLQWAASCLAVNYYQRLRGQLMGNESRGKEITGVLAYWEREFKNHDSRVRSEMRTTNNPMATWGFANTRFSEQRGESLIYY